MSLLRLFFISLLSGLCCTLPTVAQQTPPVFTAEQTTWFENRVRPLLAEHCFECHSSNAKTIRAGLKLDSRAAVLQGGDTGPAIITERPDESLLIQAVRWQGLEMPPAGKLKPHEIEVLAEWVRLGAPWPADTTASTSERSWDFNQLRSEHWAWQPIQRPAVPPVQQTAWVTSPIDAFVLSKLEASGLQPAAPASPRVLLRRLSLDLIGLPPTPTQLLEFEQAVSSNRQAAIDAAIDRLLAQPQYGERWGRFWLDVARYSDGFGGFLDAAALPHAWRYRDWVVNALNRDLPLNDFLRLQIAGDLATPPQPEATGFLALGPTYVSDGGDPDAIAQARAETLDDRVDTLTRGLLGLTVSCARCHDHKFDPVPQLDYYSLAGIFNNTQNREAPLVPAEVVQAFNDHQQQVKQLTENIRMRKEMADQQKRTLNDTEAAAQKADEETLARLQATAPAPYPVAHVLAESGTADMPLALRGNLRKPGPIAPRRMLRILEPGDAPFTSGSGRAQLAEAIINRRNPLTARVLVNRIWLQHFGQGLVRTPGNFGKLGQPPTHPELLDWLAAELHDGPAPWSLKHIHRLILRSSAWQMSSTMNATAFAMDADNRLLWRMNPRRMDVEAWRDALLSTTGELDLTQTGPPVEALLDSPRRTLYAAVSRNGDRYAADSFLRLFDFPLPRATSEGRGTSVVPQQSLFLMNSPFMAARSKALAARLEREATSDTDRIQLACQLLFGRPAGDSDQQLGLEFLAAARADAQAAAGNQQHGNASSPQQQLSPWQQYAQVLLSCSEFMHIE
ncbi:MAG: PSD1 and planctomycete cytochrome C domain-containing protein [Planctomycetaceae bacterium]